MHEMPRVFAECYPPEIVDWVESLADSVNLTTTQLKIVDALCDERTIAAARGLFSTLDACERRDAANAIIDRIKAMFSDTTKPTDVAALFVERLPDPTPIEGDDFTSQIKEVLSDDTYLYTDSDITRINRYLVIYRQQASNDAEDLTKNRARAKKSPEILAQLDNTLRDALAFIDAATENNYCGAALLDAMNETSGICDETASIDRFNQDVETLRRLSHTVSTAIQLRGKSERVTPITVSRGRAPAADASAFKTLVAKLYDVCFEIVVTRPLDRQLEKASEPVQEQIERLNKANENHKKGSTPQEAHKKLTTQIQEAIKEEIKSYKETESEVNAKRANYVQPRTHNDTTTLAASLAAIAAPLSEKRVRNILMESNPDRLPGIAIHTTGIKIIKTPG